MNTIYIFSGLGADERVFSKIDFNAHKVVFVKWILPLKSESIVDYALRISTQITEKLPILLGISFGGIVAQEIAKIKECKKLILLATIESKSELPWYIRLVGFFKIDKIVPAFLLKSHNFITSWAFGINSNDSKNLFKAILTDTNPIFMKWAIRKLLSWEQTQSIKNAITIHGTNDRILPCLASKKYDFKIKSGGHFFTIRHAFEINKILENLLD
jgi:pimeloyl-ACP methyl ester carboxylesterase